MNKYSIERWGKWGNGEQNSKCMVNRGGTRYMTVVTGVGESCYGQSGGHVVAGKEGLARWCAVAWSSHRLTAATTKHIAQPHNCSGSEQWQNI